MTVRLTDVKKQQTLKQLQNQHWDQSSSWQQEPHI
jgi:hypothetical protein